MTTLINFKNIYISIVRFNFKKIIFLFLTKLNFSLEILITHSMISYVFLKVTQLHGWERINFMSKCTFLLGILHRGDICRIFYVVYISDASICNCKCELSMTYSLSVLMWRRHDNINQSSIIEISVLLRMLVKEVIQSLFC